MDARGGGAPYDPHRPLALMHIPKSAGTSLTEALATVLAPQRSVTGFDGVLFGAFDAFDTLDVATRGAIFHTPEALPEADLVAGHFSFSTLRARYPDAQLMTVLREPLTRLLSLWLYWRGHSDERLVGWGAWGDMVRLSRLDLASFLADPRLACQTDNQALRMLLWPHKLIPANGVIDPSHDDLLLDEAHTRLRQFAVADVAEGGLAKRLHQWLGQPLALGHQNETANIPAHLRRPLPAELTAQALQSLAHHCRLDRQLWSSVARARLDCDIEHLAESARLLGIARFAGLMNPSS